MLALKVENISKQYRLGQIGTGTLSHDLNRAWHKLRGKEDPYLKIGETNDRSERAKSEYVWALQDINFEIQQGDAVGIIGKNGAGKSTLLKILSKVTTPSTGKIYTNGRIASLLEVGTGFHPEMTGRENIFLNGAILGMTKREIKNKFDEIVDFSGVEKYIDTPVKRYSSGMYVRLAFAVAAHLESEILIVDEVLAVGDAEFQKKCLGKMGDMSKAEGRTVLFVSHNMGAVQNLCKKGILLEKGRVSHTGDIEEVIDVYSSLKRDDLAFITDFKKYNTPHFPYFIPLFFGFTDENLNITNNTFTKDTDIFIKFEFNMQQQSTFFKFGILVYNLQGEVIFMSYHNDKSKEESPQLVNGTNTLMVKIPKHLLNEGEYSIELLASLHGSPNLWTLTKGPMLNLVINGGLSESHLWTIRRRGYVAPILDFQIINSSNE